MELLQKIRRANRATLEKIKREHPRRMGRKRISPLWQEIEKRERELDAKEAGK